MARSLCNVFPGLALELRSKPGNLGANLGHFLLAFRVLVEAAHQYLADAATVCAASIRNRTLALLLGVGFKWSRVKLRGWYHSWGQVTPVQAFRNDLPKGHYRR